MKPIKNIRLISPQDSLFVQYKQSFKKQTPKMEKVRSNSEMISSVLELTTREWVKTSGKFLEKRIITFDKFDFKSKTYKAVFEEIDFVLRDGRDIILGEVKTSYSDKGVFPKATKQLIRKGELLKRIGFKVKFQIIFFDLCHQATSNPLNKFSNKYPNSVFSSFCNNNVTFEYLHLSPVELFQWGVKNKTIKTPELLHAALLEANERFINQTDKLSKKPLSLPTVQTIQIGNFSNCSQGKCNKSETVPPPKDISKVIKLFDKDIEKDIIIIARNNWLKRHSFIIPDSGKLMNLCIQIKNKSVRRAFYGETMSQLLKKLNYEIVVLN